MSEKGNNNHPVMLTAHTEAQNATISGESILLRWPHFIREQHGGLERKIILPGINRESTLQSKLLSFYAARLGGQAAME